MGNIHTSQPPVEALRSRLKVLLDNVNFLYKSGATVFEEDLVTAYSSAMDIFIKSLDGSIIGAVAKITAGAPANPLHYNVFMSSISKDLEAIYTEIATVDRLVTSSFNSIIAEREQALQISRRISDKLGTYLLYADPSLGGGFFFGDSFNSAEHIEVGSSLVDTEECFLGQNEGVILLPLDGEPEQPKIKSYIVNENSNGVAGNNSEIDVLGKDELEAIGDNEPNTWFEYERVTAFESNQQLIFDITIVLDELSVINHININPMNFGTPTPIKVESIETSKDGIEYVSIKDEIPIKDFVSEEEDNVFELSPATSKLAGQGFYSFLPRKVQYVHIVLEQHTPYAITTVNGTRLRYAIGIRDINIFGRRFKPEGSIVSTPFSVNGNARKVAMWASENPTEQSELSDVSHAISENDGAVWRPLQPLERSTHNIPEVIDYNTIADSSISTNKAVETLRHKIFMSRNIEAFEGDTILKEEKISQVDIVSAPTGGDFSLTTTQEPISETVRIALPFYGSFSCPTVRYGSSIVGASAPMDLDFVEFTVDVPPVETLRFDLPYVNISNLIEHIRVFVNGEQIEYVSKDANALGANSYTSYGPVDGDSKVYFLNKGGRQIQFGHTISGTRYGFLPPTGSRIQICLDGDNPRLELTDKGYVLNLTHPSDGFKDNVSIVSMDNLTEAEAVDHVIDLSPGRDSFIVHGTIGNNASSITRTWSPPEISRVGGEIPPVEQGEIDAGDDTQAVINEVQKTSVFEAKKGVLPPIFIEDSSTWSMEEYEYDGTAVASPQFTTKREFIDGRQELLDWSGSAWVINENAYTFDAYSGIVYTGSSPITTTKTKFRCKKLKATSIANTDWEYYRSSVTGKIDTSKIVIQPEHVSTHKRSVSINGVTTQLKSVQLVGDQNKTHDWFKQKLVKGTVKISPDIFPDGSKPTEVVFVNGDLELHGVTQVSDELITFSGSNPYTFYLDQIDENNILDGAPGFAPVRSITDPNTEDSQFVTLVTGTPSSNGEWSYTTVSNRVLVTVYQSGGMNAHTTSYKYTVSDPGVDIFGLYSIDYDSGTIHFAEEIERAGTIEFDVSAYTSFYNMAEVVGEGDIKEIDETGKSITMSTSFGIRFLKLNTAMKARPAFIKVMYEYYKRSTESLKDLEPYFSPICKDVAFKVVRANTLEEL